MKPVKDLLIFLVVEIAAVIWAEGSFKVIPSLLIAGAFAGSFFLVTGFWMLWRVLRWPRWWEAWVFYPLLVYIFGCTIPMLWERFSHPLTAFADIKIWGIPGPEFHHVSASVYGLLILVTLVEAGAALFKKRPRTS